MPDMQLIRGRPRHPSTQGSVESANKAIKDKMAAMFEETGSRDWVSMLPQIVHAMNTTPHSATGKAPFEVVYGQKPRSRIIWPGTTAEEHPIIDEEQIQDLISDPQPDPDASTGGMTP